MPPGPSVTAPAFRFLDRQRLEHTGTQRTLAVVLQRVEDLVGVQRQGFRHPAHALIIVEIERIAIAALGPD